MRAGHVVFTHDIDSRHNFNVSEPCPFTALPNGDDMETGRMRRSDRQGGPMTDYEEVWRYLPLQSVPENSGGNTAWVLESVDCLSAGSQNFVTKQFLAKVGRFYLVQQQEQTRVRKLSDDGTWTVKITGGPVSARREEWTGDCWEERYVLGPRGDKLPSMSKDYIGSRSSWTLGEKVTIGGSEYVVREIELLLALRPRI